MTGAPYTRIAIPDACLLDKRMVQEHWEMTAADKLSPEWFGVGES